MTPLTTTGIVVYESADKIREGEVFIAKVETIKGKRRVTLVRQKDPIEGTENDLIIKELLAD